MSISPLVGAGGELNQRVWRWGRKSNGGKKNLVNFLVDYNITVLNYFDYIYTMHIIYGLENQTVF